MKPLIQRIGKIRTAVRNWLNEMVSLTGGHWKWAVWGIFSIMILLMAGLWFDFMGDLHPGVYLAALGFLLGLPLLAGLGVKLGLTLLNLLPERYNWFFFGTVFFVLFNFHFPEKALIAITLIILVSGSFTGAGLYNITGGRWNGLKRGQRILTPVFLSIGTVLFLGSVFYIAHPGKRPPELTPWSMEAANLPSVLDMEDPSQSGRYPVDSITYGWGKDRRRPEFGEEAGLITPVVDGSSFLEGWEKFSGKMRTFYWKMSPDSLALNGRVWFPSGEGPFPLVLMVHGNHLDRDFSDPGYGYLGRHFASHGIIAVSVDENFLNGAWSDIGGRLESENDCRGWLLLKHLEQWDRWNRTDTSLFHGKVDMERVVLIGHSRGGEAVAIAALFNQLPYYPDNAEEIFDFGFGIRGVAAIAPVDGQYWPGGIATPVSNVNYFTIHGSLDADMRSFDGLRQMVRVEFTDTSYHFASGLYVHGANHGQFNTSWGLFDIGYPQYLMLNRRAIIPAEQQERTALVYLTAFVMENIQPGSGYLPLFRDYRKGRHWLPGLVFLNQFHESAATVLCGYDEDLDLTTGTEGTDTIVAKGLALWKEGRLPKKWGDLRNNGVFLGWNNDSDTIPGFYRVVLDTAATGSLEGSTHLTFLAADAQTDPGERIENSAADSLSGERIEIAAADSLPGTVGDPEPEKSISGTVDGPEREEGVETPGTGKKTTEAPPEVREDAPLDFSVVLTDSRGSAYRARLSDFQMLQPAIKPQVFKSRLFWEDPESEVILQYVALPLGAFLNDSLSTIAPGEIRSIELVFDGDRNGTIVLDQLGFTRQVRGKL